MSKPRSARRFPLGPVAALVLGWGLIAVAVDMAGAGEPRGLQIAAAVPGTVFVLLGLFWVCVAGFVWRGVAGPWWFGMDEEESQLHDVQRLLGHLDRNREQWTRASLDTVGRLHADNLALCSRMDKISYTASWRSGWHLSSRPAALEPMWRSLTEGRERHRQLCTEMRSMAGHRLAASPLFERDAVVDERVVEELNALAERIKILDRARREVLSSAGLVPHPPDRPPPPRLAGTRPLNPAAEVVSTLRSRAPELATEAAAVFARSARRVDSTADAMRRWRQELQLLPAETPTSDRDAFVSGRQTAISAAEAFVGRILAGEGAVAEAARNLSAVPPVPPPPPPEYTRDSVEAAKGMIDALRELHRRSEGDGRTGIQGGEY